jgi:cytoskeletal protein CcmA (bactofilin family)
MAHARTGRTSSSGEVSSIGAGTRIRGRVTGEGDLVIGGQVEGDVVVRGDVTIADGARCTSNVEGHAVVVSGELSGDVSASGPVTIGATARLRGNVHGATISLEDGASFAGRIDCDFELPEGLGDSRSAPARRR